MTVPVSSDPNDGYYKTDDGATAYLAKSTYAYDAQADTLTDTVTGTVYTADNKTGVFVDSAGNELTPGWRVFVGFSNYKNMVTSNDLGGPFLKALIWSFVFAAARCSRPSRSAHPGACLLRQAHQGPQDLPVPHDPALRLPGLPGDLVWKGMLNTDFGFINQVFLGGAHVPWLDNACSPSFRSSA